MAKTISFFNIKGGVGKSTSSAVFAEIIANLGRKVLVLDMDPQGNTSMLFGKSEEEGEGLTNLIMLKGAEVTKENVKKCIQKTEYKNIDIIPSNLTLSLICSEIANDLSRTQQYIIKRALKTIKEEYDFIIIDNTPFYNILGINALCASDHVITPVEADGFSYIGFSQMIDKMSEIKQEFNEDLNLIGCFFTKVEEKKKIVKTLISTYEGEIGEIALKSYIRKDKLAPESTLIPKPLMEYSKGKNYRALTDYKALLIETRLLEENDQKKLEKEVQKEREEEEKQREVNREKRRIKK